MPSSTRSTTAWEASPLSSRTVPSSRSSPEEDSTRNVPVYRRAGTLNEPDGPCHGGNVTRTSARSAPAGGGGVEGTGAGGRRASRRARHLLPRRARGRGRARVSVARHPPPRNGGSDGTPSTGARCAPRGDREPRPLRRSHAAARSAASSGFSPRICARCASGRHAVVEPRRKREDAQPRHRPHARCRPPGQVASSVPSGLNAACPTLPSCPRSTSGSP